MKRTFKPIVRVALTGAMLACAMVVSGSAPPVAAPAAVPEFRFARMIYTTRASMGGGFGRWEMWTTDMPEAETHLLQGVRRLTRIDAAPQGIALRLTDDELFDHPFLYAVEVGRWLLDEQEAARLREYLLRGGFLMVDDFHGSLQWETFMESMRLVFPDRQVVDIGDDDEVFHVLYDLDQRVQIPGIWGAMNGRTYEQDGYTPHWRGIYDDRGRLMVAINFNMDLGDAWEHADTPEYPQPLTALAYRFGINYLLYSMTH